MKNCSFGEYQQSVWWGSLHESEQHVGDFYFHFMKASWVDEVEVLQVFLYVTVNLDGMSLLPQFFGRHGCLPHFKCFSLLSPKQCTMTRERSDKKQTQFRILWFRLSNSVELSVLLPCKVKGCCRAGLYSCQYDNEVAQQHEKFSCWVH